jgi:hypothetical protein
MKPTVVLAMRAAFGPIPGALLSCCLLFALWLPIGSAVANEVTDWNVIIEETAKASSVKPGVILSGRNVSLMHLAMHDALNSISRRHDSYGVHRSSPDANPRAAVMAAGHGVAARLYPDQASSLDNLYSKMLLTIPDEPGKNEGLVLGDEVAAKIVALRADDHFDYAIPGGEPFVSGNGPYGSGPGAWVPAPDSPHQNAVFSRASLVTPLALKSPSQFRNLLPGPLNLSSGKYSRELEEFRSLGGKASTVRTPDQTMIAMVWGETSLFRTFNEIARNLISARNDDLWESNRTLALLNVAMADSYVAVFDAKYHYQFWRPTMAIRWADGNEKTTSGSWLPLLPTPPFPEYPSGHAAACGSAQIILEGAFGRSTPFAATGTTLFPAGYSRNFSSFDDASRECVEGRMLSGQHFRFSDEDARYLGQHVSRYVIRNILAAR